MKYLVGIDVGTTGTKSLLFDESGNIISSAYKGYELLSTKAGYAEQDPKDWYDAVIYTVRECARAVPKEKIRAISISAQGGTTVAVDNVGTPVRNAISWLDRRAYKEAQALCEKKDKEYYYLHTGWRLNDGYNLAQIKWMEAHEPKKFSKTDKFLSPLSYLNLRFTGKAVTDYTNEGITNLENIHTWSWDQTVYEELGLTDERLPEILPAGTVLGTLKKEAAEIMGLSEETLVINGGYDQYCAALGLGAVEKGDLMLSTGTAWVLMAITDTLRFDVKSYISPCRHIVPDRYGAMASLETGGVSLDWFKNKVASDHEHAENYKRLNEEIEKIGPGADGVLFYPHFAGTTCPHWSKNSRGAFLGLTLYHGRYHMARAVMEGVVYEMYAIIKAYEQAGIEVKTIRLAGGAAKSKVWTQMIADITQVPVIIYENADAAARGAGIIAAVGAGIYADFTQAAEKFQTKCRKILPHVEKKEIYRKNYIRYQQGFQELKHFYDKEENDETKMSEA
ncbi:FGGY-family carbohydrate kinase [Mediterraneibacter massiliensis]|uniref:FGGY-family carbohydrate kinase n=1 Tax=Mediterraneibacter massiliensis TaxID=1720300 RepID=UPI0022E2D84F|nr:FGGY family carbohydrate kinase [Mediterraneibacter massiliensis]